MAATLSLHLLCGARRDTLELFCRWLSDAVSEGQLRLLPDLLHALQHSACPEAAISAVHTHLSQFFTHRMQVRELGSWGLGLGIGAGAGACLSLQGSMTPICVFQIFTHRMLVRGVGGLGLGRV